MVGVEAGVVTLASSARVDSATVSLPAVLPIAVATGVVLSLVLSVVGWAAASYPGVETTAVVKLPVAAVEAIAGVGVGVGVEAPVPPPVDDPLTVAYGPEDAGVMAMFMVEVARVPGAQSLSLTGPKAL